MAWIGTLILFVVMVLIVVPFYNRKLFDSLSSLSKGKLSRIDGVLLWIVSSLLFIGVWAFFSDLEPEGVNKIPSPLQTLSAGWRLLTSGKLLSEAMVSCLRIVVGFVTASLVGVSVGLIAGSFLIANRIIQPINSFLRYIPPTAFISLLIVYFGVGETYKYAVIFFGVIFFIIQMVIDVVEDIDRRYVEMALTTGYSNWRVFKEVILPASLPRVFDVLRINLSASWTFLVAAELIGAQSGLGHLIAMSQRYLRIDELYVGILSFGLIGVITDRGLELASRSLFRWYYLSLKQ